MQHSALRNASNHVPAAFSHLRLRIVLYWLTLGLTAMTAANGASPAVTGKMRFIIESKSTYPGGWNGKGALEYGEIRTPQSLPYMELPAEYLLQLTRPDLYPSNSNYADKRVEKRSFEAKCPITITLNEGAGTFLATIVEKCRYEESKNGNLTDWWDLWQLNWGSTGTWSVSGDTLTLRSQPLRNGHLSYTETTSAFEADFTLHRSPADAPSIAPNSRVFLQPIEVKLTSKAGAIIRYTVDGTEPTSSSAVYTGPFTLSKPAIVKARTSHVLYLDSAISTAVFKPAPPTISPNGSNFTGSESVQLSCTTPGAEIRFTVDGTAPTSGSSLYTGPIVVSETSTVKAGVFFEANISSDVASADFRLTKLGPPVIAPHGGTFPDSAEIQITSVSGATIRYSIDGSTPSATSPIYTKPIILTHSATVKAKSFRTGVAESEEVSAAFTIESETCVWVAKGSAFSSFGDPTSWQGGRVPKMGDKAVFGTSGPALVQIDATVKQTGLLKAVRVDASRCTFRVPVVSELGEAALSTDELSVAEGASLGTGVPDSIQPNRYPAIVTNSISVRGELRATGRNPPIQVNGNADCDGFSVRVTPSGDPYAGWPILVINGNTTVRGEIEVRVDGAYTGGALPDGGRRYRLMQFRKGLSSLKPGSDEPLRIKNPEISPDWDYFWGLIRRVEGWSVLPDEYLELTLMQKPRIWRSTSPGPGRIQGRMLSPSLGAPKKKLFLLTHGTKSSIGEEWDQGTFAHIASMVAWFLRVNNLSDWDVATLDWSEYSTHPDLNPNDFFVNPATSAEACIGIAESLENWIRKRQMGSPLLSKLQLLGHSSASWFVQRFAQRVTKGTPLDLPLLSGPVQLTFFDAFTPPGNPDQFIFGGRFNIGALGSGFGQGTIHPVEHYVHEVPLIKRDHGADEQPFNLPWTNDTLQHARNIDVTQAPIPVPPYSGRNLHSKQIVEGHAYPYYWYRETVKAALSQRAPLYEKETSSDGKRHNLWGFATSLPFQEVEVPELLNYRDLAREMIDAEPYGGRRFLLGRLRTAAVPQGLAADVPLTKPGSVDEQGAARSRFFPGATPIVPEEIEILPDGSLRITTTSSARYTATNPVAFSAQALKVYFQFQSPEEGTIAPGSDAKLSFWVNGTNVLEIKQSDAGLDRLIERSVVFASPTEASNHVVQIQLEAIGEIAPRARIARVQMLERALQVPVLPVITLEPQTQKTSFGSPVLLTVEADTEEEISYQWYKNDKPIYGAVFPVLDLGNGQAQDAGIYHVRVSNSQESVDSQKVAVEVEIWSSRQSGAFVALIQPDSEHPSEAGALAMNISQQGVITGKLKQGGRIYSIRALMNEDGFASTVLPLSQGTLTIQMKVDGTFTAQVDSLNTSVTYLGNAIAHFTEEEPNPYLGSYTGAFEVDGVAGPNEPTVGNGFGIMKVQKSGAVTLTARLGDDSRISVGAAISGFGGLPIYLPLQSKKGVLSGTLNFEPENDETDVSGTFSWHNPASKSGAISTIAHFTGSRFVPATRGEYVLPGLVQSSGSVFLEFVGGGFTTPQGTNISISPSGRNVPTAKLRVNNTSGLFTGTFVPSGGGHRHPFRGAFIQKQNRGTGLFRSGHRVGTVELSPQ